MTRQHPARHEQTPWERCARFIGTPKYLVGQSVFMALWIALNLVAFFHHWDAYPFILLNLLLSTQASYAAPIIQLAANEEAERDRKQAAADYEHNVLTLQLVRDLHSLHPELQRPEVPPETKP